MRYIIGHGVGVVDLVVFLFSYHDFINTFPNSDSMMGLRLHCSESINHISSDYSSYTRGIFCCFPWSSHFKFARLCFLPTFDSCHHFGPGFISSFLHILPCHFFLHHGVDGIRSEYGCLCSSFIISWKNIYWAPIMCLAFFQT